MRILVTGANGYLGCGIVTTLLDKGHEVIAVDRYDDNIDSRSNIITTDIFSETMELEEAGNADTILHLAWRDGFVHYADSHIDDLPKHYKLIKKFIGLGARKISVMGSMHEIGFFEGSINENTPCNPITPYGISKNALRMLTKQLCGDEVTFQWLRGFYIVGNTLNGSSIFSKIASAANEGEKEFPFTQGLNQFDFIDYKDFCTQVVAAITQDEINGIINICSGRPEKLADRVERFINDNGYDIRLKYGAFPDRPYDSKAVWGDDAKIRMILKAESMKL